MQFHQMNDAANDTDETGKRPVPYRQRYNHAKLSATLGASYHICVFFKDTPPYGGRPSFAVTITFIT